MTLDGVERTFTDDDLLICDAERPVAVAGVMGGELAEVSEQTSDVLLEAAWFERGGVQRTRRRIGLSTEASMRFERGADPEAAPVGADRACRLMVEWCGARVLAGRDRGRRALRPGAGSSSGASRASALIGYPVSTAGCGGGVRSARDRRRDRRRRRRSASRSPGTASTSSARWT